VTSGYSGTPLSKKLGVEAGSIVGTFGADPGFLRRLLEPLPEDVVVSERPDAVCDVIVAFAVTALELEERFAAALELLPAAGGLWVAWPKRSSGVATKLDFDVVQAHGLERGLVDNKVCAIDDIWSGLRFVVRVADRAAWPR